MSRRIVLWVGVVTLLLVCLAIAILVRTNQQTVTPVGPTPTPTTSPIQKQQTLLMSVRSDAGLIADAVTLGTQMSSTTGGREVVDGSWLSMQPGLAVDVTQEGQVTIADRGPGAPVDTGAIIGNQLGFGITNVMVLDRLAFAALVDAVNGVTVKVEEPIVALDTEGKPEVLVPKGPRKLYGPAAADYVITLNPGESPRDRMARYDDVLRQVVVKLPGDVDRTRNIVASLGSSSRTSGSVDDMAHVLVEMRTALLDSTVTNGTPIASAQKSGGRIVYVVDPSETQPVVVKLFVESVLIPGYNSALPRVRVYDAGVSFGNAVEASQALLGIDQSMVWGGQIEEREKSVIYVPDASLRPLGLKTAAALKLPASAVKVDPDQTVGVQVAVVLAPDSGLITPSPTSSGSASQ